MARREGRTLGRSGENFSKRNGEAPVQREDASDCEEEREKKEMTMWDETEGDCVGGCERQEGGEQKQKA